MVDQILFSFSLLYAGGHDLKMHKQLLSKDIGIKWGFEYKGTLDELGQFIKGFHKYSIKNPILFLSYSFKLTYLDLGEIHYVKSYLKNGKESYFDACDRVPGPEDYDESLLSNIQ